MATRWTFTYGIRVDLTDLEPRCRVMTPIDTKAMTELVLAADIDTLAVCEMLPGGYCHQVACSALVDRWSDNPVDFDRDIAPRIDLTVALLGFDDRERPLYGSVEYLCTVVCDDEAFGRGIMQNAADEWYDGDASGYEFRQVEEAV
jgi:hypothetical protein